MLYGSYYVLATTNMWFVAAGLWVVCVGALWPMREVLEGAPYNTSFASVWGDIALIGVVAIAAYLLQSGTSVPLWAAGPKWQWICGGVGLAVGVFFVFGPSPLWRSYFTDNYHNLVVMGLLVYLLLSVAPVILWSGSLFAIGASIFCLALWAALLAVDVLGGRLDQREWLKENDPVRYKLLR